MKRVRTSPWLAVTIGILGLAAGYTMVIVQHGNTAFANSAKCPYHDAVTSPV